VILAEPSAAQRGLNELQELKSDYILAYTELGDELPTRPRARIALDCHMKATLSIDETRYVRLQPFLLIDRT
jgi:hypothetical protein